MVGSGVRTGARAAVAATALPLAVTLVVAGAPTAASSRGVNVPPDKPSATVEPTGPGPSLKPGYPVAVRNSGGSYQLGSTAVLVGDVDGDRGLEVFLSGIASGSITAVEPDGTPIRGWPTTWSTGHEYLGMMEADPARPGLEVVLAEWGDYIMALDGHGDPLPGWPRRLGNYGSSSPSAADLLADRRDEVAFTAETGEYQVLDAEGNVPRGTQWPVDLRGVGQALSQPTLADVVGDDRPEVLGGGLYHHTFPEPNVFAFRADGSTVGGWPFEAEGFTHMSRFVVGQVDDDSSTEIGLTGHGFLRGDGTLEHPVPALGRQAAVADVDEDGDHEVVTLHGSSILLQHGDGTVLPGFPVETGFAMAPSEYFPPVVADLDNDGHQDIIVSGENEAGTTSVHAVSRVGAALPGFPMTVPVEASHRLAAADLDGNGRTELVVAGTHPEPYGGWFPGLYVYEFPTGEAAPPAWSQYGGGPRHQFTPGQTLVAPADPPAAAPITNRARLVSDLVPGPAGSAPEQLTRLGRGFVLTADTPEAGRELWVTDGTATGTSMLRDVRAGAATSYPDELTAAGGQVFFVAGDDVRGRELWRTDGSIEGTRPVLDIRSGSAGSDPAEVTRVGDRVFFSADDGDGRELWVSDGTEPGTRLVVDTTPDPGEGSDPEALARAGDRLVYDAADTVTDPNEARLILYATDGTAAGTKPLPVKPRRGYRRAQSGARWATIQVDEKIVWTDGTPLGTHVAGDGTVLGPVSQRRGIGLSAGDVSSVGPGFGTVVSRPGKGARQLYAAHGSTIQPVVTPADIQPFRDGWLFSARGPGNGRELWFSDSTRAGTRMVVDLVAGSRGSSPTVLLVDRGMALVRASVPSSGDELWRTDGTAAGTSRVADLAVGLRGSHPRDPVVLGDRILFTIDDGRAGRELWSMPRALLGPLPDTVVRSRPNHRTTRRVAVVRFRATLAGSAFDCRLDDGSWRACTTPWRRKVVTGSHVLRIRATSTLGLRESVPAIIRWRVRRS